MDELDFNFEDLQGASADEGSALITLPDDVTPDEEGNIDLNGDLDTGKGGEEVLEKELEDFKKDSDPKTKDTPKESEDKRPKPEVIELEDIDESSEEKETKETSLETPQGKNKEASQENPNPYLPFAQVLTKEGFFTEEQLETINQAGDKAKDTFLESIRENLEESFQEYVDENIPKELKSMIENYRKGVPLQELAQIYDARTAYNNISDEALKENEKYQEKVMSDYFRLKGLEEAEALDMVESLKEAGKLEDKSVSAKKAIIDYYDKVEEEKAAKVQEAQQRQAEQNAQMLKDIQSNIKSTEEIIPGIKLDKDMKKKVFGNMTKATDTDKNGNPISAVQAIRAKDPIEFEKRLNYYAAMGFFDEKPDFSFLERKIKSKVVDGIDDVVTKYNAQTKKSGVAAPASKSTPSDTINYDEMLNGF